MESLEMSKMDDNQSYMFKRFLCKKGTLAISLLLFSLMTLYFITVRVVNTGPITMSVENIPLQAPSRVAICITGQLRSLNMHPLDPNFPRNFHPMKTIYKNENLSSMTIAESIQKRLFSSLSNFDVFMSVSTREGKNEPAVNNISYCEPLRPRNNDSFFKCEVPREKELPVYPGIMDSYFYADKFGKQSLLPQLFSLTRCSSLIREHMVETGISYKYIIRLRPDTAVLSQFPSLDELNIKRNEIRVMGKRKCCCGNEDWFGVGHADVMFPYLDRYYSLQTHDWYGEKKSVYWTSDGRWNSEGFFGRLYDQHL